jgi:hypothetical protein
VFPDQHIRKSDTFLREIYRRLSAKEDFFSGLEFVYLSFACGCAWASEEFMVSEQIEYPCVDGALSVALDLETGHRHADHSD